mgnify:CR=1 FL=1
MITSSEILLTETHLINEEDITRDLLISPCTTCSIHSYKILSVVQLHFRKEIRGKQGFHSKSSQDSRKSEPCSSCLTSWPWRIPPRWFFPSIYRLYIKRPRRCMYRCDRFRRCKQYKYRAFITNAFKKITGINLFRVILLLNFGVEKYKDFLC